MGDGTNSSTRSNFDKPHLEIKCSLVLDGIRCPLKVVLFLLFCNHQNCLLRTLARVSGGLT
ncbi:MAG: hypothetical protein ACI8RD_001234 [Bacillariaceae sp.]|jgi:hypothetical protein